MPQKAGKCTNFGLCTMADSREAITLPEGEDFSCPECGKMLAEVEGKGGAGGSGGGKGSGKSKLVLGGLAIALLAGGVYFLAVGPDSDDTGKTTPTPSPTVVVEPTPSQTPVPTPVQTPVPTAIPPTPLPTVVIPPTRLPHIAPTRLPTAVPTTPTPTPVTTPVPTPTPIVETGANSGTLIWEGTVHGTEFVTIENGVASRGTLISGRLPGKPVLIEQDNSKKVAIAGAPGPDSKYQRLVLRIQGKGQVKVVLNWSLLP